MFCPNCGTQNPDTAQTCSKCSFHLKGAAAPKFKGTMLMMNQPPPSPAGTAPRTPPPPAPFPPPPAPAPGRAGGGGALPMPGQVPNKLKGTMVGVAPMAGGLPPPPAPPPAFGGSAPPPPFAPPPYAPPASEGAGAFSPPVPQAGVNPLGGTVAADAGVFAAYAAQHAPGAAGGSPGMPPPPFGAPPLGGTLAMQAPPSAYSPGNPPPPFGAGGPPPPGAGLTPFGVPPVPGGAPPFPGPANSHGGMDGAPLMPPPAMGGTQVMSNAAMVPAGGSALAPYSAGSSGIAGTLKSEASVVLGPKKRNPVTTLLLPIGVVVGGLLLGSLLGLLLAPLSGVGVVVAAGGMVWLLLISIQMLSELRTVTRAPSLVWWPLIVPGYNMYFMATVVLGEVTKAKQMLNVQPPPQPALLYALLGPYALASDLNDLVR